MITRFGSIQIDHAHSYSKSPNQFNISPLLQSHLLVLTQELPYTKAHELAALLLGKTLSRSTLYRLTQHYGQAIEADLTQAPKSAAASGEVVYALADGLMLLMEDGYRETKLGRIFPAKTLTPSTVKDRGGQITGSDYVAHVGSWPDFWAKWQVHLSAVVAAGNELVFISDGVLWLYQQLRESYPDAVMILDIYHVMAHLSEAARVGIVSDKSRKLWLKESYRLLTESNLDAILVRLGRLRLGVDLRRRLVQYLESNRDRMDYKTYLVRGFCIGSGAIESANKSVVQARLKRSGQRWTTVGAQRVLNLRSCWMSGRWNVVSQHIEPINCAMAA